jgi:hypothetical protein
VPDILGLFLNKLGLCGQVFVEDRKSSFSKSRPVGVSLIDAVTQTDMKLLGALRGYADAAKDVSVH